MVTTSLKAGHFLPRRLLITVRAEDAQIFQPGVIAAHCSAIARNRQYESVRYGARKPCSALRHRATSASHDNPTTLICFPPGDIIILQYRMPVVRLASLRQSLKLVSSVWAMNGLFFIESHCFRSTILNNRWYWL